MGLVLVVPVMLQLVKLSVICALLTVHGSTGYDISPSPASLSVEITPTPVSWSGNPSRSASQHHGLGLLAPLASPPLMFAPRPRTKRPAPSSANTPMEPMPHNAAPPPLTDQEHSPSSSPRFPFVSPSNPTATPSSTIHADAPSVLPGAPREKTPAVATPPTKFPQIAPAISPSAPGTFPPTSHQRNASKSEAPVVESIAPVAPPPRPTIQPNIPGTFSPPPDEQERNASNNKAPIQEPIAPAAPPPRPTIQPNIPGTFSPTPDEQERNASNNEAPIQEPIAPVAPPLRPIIQPNIPGPFSPTPDEQERNASNNKSPIQEPIAPVAPPPRPATQPNIPGTFSPTPDEQERNASNNKAPIQEPIAPVAPLPRPTMQPNIPGPFSPTPGEEERNASNNKAPIQEPIAPVAPPLRPTIQPNIPGTFSPTSGEQERNASNNKAPIQEPVAPVVPPPPPTIHPSIPATLPPTSHQRNESNYEAPIVAPVAPAPRTRGDSPPIHHQRNVSDDKAPEISPTTPDTDVSPAATPSVDWEEGGVLVAAPPNDIPKLLPPVNHSPTKAPSKHNAIRHHQSAPVPSLVSHRPPQDRDYLSPALSPSSSFHKPHHARDRMNIPSPAYVIPLPPNQQGPASSPAFLPLSKRRQNAHAPAPFDPGSLISPSRHHFPPSISHASPTPSPFPSSASVWTQMPILSPKASPSGSPPRSPKIPLLPPTQSLPPPPPNKDCSSTECKEPYTNAPSGSPCGCVRPIQVGLRLSVALYTFFPLVPQLAEEIAAGVFLKQGQVRIIGANAASQNPEKTIVLTDLVPLEEMFDNTTAFLTYHRFWHKQVVINPSLFGQYDVLYVRYPGLPPSPPSAPSVSMIDGGPYSANGNNARAIKPLGVDVRNGQHKDDLSGGIVAVIVLSVLVAVVLCGAVAWVLLFKHRDSASQPASIQQSFPATVLKPSRATGSVKGSGISSTSLSFGSSIAPYKGSAKTFSTADIERATDNLNASRVLGEGGFGCVYSGVLEDGTKVAVKVLKRDDQQGGREFLAEVEMLSRLHHRNLVKLIGICTEERSRCLVYELIPNGSVESHLHGVDKEAAPLDWDARVKIALGAARGLAYLHEDSSPRVIHRDFKASNILLEHDFTPKVSDFGLARVAMDEDNRHISTRVMGTFGYVAPEYAMTGHLLVKSDVYSYGVVLLELLTGRRPIDMSQPPGQENLVAWARPLLTSREGLETIIDKCLGPDAPFDSIAKVAAIASMCVQTEVTHRPFMGEVVQALNLVCNECDEAKEVGSRTSSRENLSIDVDAGVSTSSRQPLDPLQSQYHMPRYDFGPDTEMGLSASDLFSASVRLDRQASGSFRRYSSSGPLRTERGRQFWQTIRGLTGGSLSEHGVMFKVQPGSH
ncbi:Serine/threonine-protein kinase PBS1 isoform 1 [Tripterygium wilfordii]|uniref:Serine/threonine-protein kinase PBS1 isoform 1 n=1 Tax=Tripterygium wilfordii TaxID=458696 RepID=A0A7J7D9L8_TRIWF|nr:Serine/threonine-protein kinase PBS1 isoform 1 [Tripterygium wilfordii]